MNTETQRVEIASEIEAGLEHHRVGRWRRLTEAELKAKVPEQFVLGWQVSVPPRSLQFAEVDYLVLAIDNAFPNSQPRVFAPAAGSDFFWPHVEQKGLLCLRPSRNTASPAERIAVHLDDAEELLNYPEMKRREEFEREFVAYWGQRATAATDRDKVLSLVSPRGIAREVFFFHDGKTHRYVIGDDKTSLKKWLRNSGVNPSDKEIFSTWLFRLSRPWTPKEFPGTGGEIIRLLPPNLARQCLMPGMKSPFLFEVQTPTGTAFAAVVLRGSGHKDLVKGFRNISKVPVERIISSYAKRPVERHAVSRVDGAWVHGRDQPSSYAEIKGRKVSIVGCGAIGSALARLLAQAGVGEIIFVDGDSLSTANISRHALGIEYIGLNKALSLQSALRKQFPHLTFEHVFPKRFERLSSKELDYLASADLILTAGIDFDGEAALDTWRRTLPRPPAYISTWAEAYAIVGHAVMLFGNNSILTGFDAEERPKFRLTDWPEEAGALIVEAGCGNTFQPHGVIDLHPIIGLAASLALDGLLNRVLSSCRRVWMGDPTIVEAHGGKTFSTFTDRSMIREFVWQ